MPERTLIIIGGGLGGLAAGCYARMNGWRTRIFEHGLAPGGLCTSWRRGEYTIDSSVHWILGGAPGGFLRGTLEELGIVPEVTLRPLELFARFEHPEGWAVDIVRDLGALVRDLVALSPEDADTIARLFAAIDALGDGRVSADAREMQSIAQRLRELWESRLTFGPQLSLRGSIAEWCARNLRGARLRDVLIHLVHPETPMMFLAVLLGHLAAGQLVRPIGGSGKLRDALVARYHALGGEVMTNVTVDEILITDGKATGIRLDDGTQVRGDAVVSTSSAFENIQRLLGGRFGDGATWDHLSRWPTMQPSLLVNTGVALPLGDVPHTLLLRQAVPFSLGGPDIDLLRVRTSSDDPTLAPPGRAVVQTSVPTSWDHWAEAGDAYHVEKQRALARILEHLEPRFPGITDALEVSDVATPLSFWRYARAWRGAYEGWLPTTETFGVHPSKKIASVGRLYFAGQWVEPGGGVPTSLLSGRQVVQLLCADAGQPFAVTPPEPLSEAHTC